MTRIVTADEAAIQEAALLLQAGEIVAFPTETVYGLGADGLNAAAVDKIFEAKGRPRDNPLILHVDSWEAVGALTRPPVPRVLREVAEAFWPGPLTVVLPAAVGIPEAVRGGLETVAVRIPDHPVALALLKALGRPVAAPSANRSGRPSPTDAAAVLQDLEERVPLILDGGPTRYGVESTVVDLSTTPPVLLRPGGIPQERLETLLGPLAVPRRGGPARAPGMKYTHYAPETPVLWVETEDPEAVLDALTEQGQSPRTLALLAPHGVVKAIGAHFLDCFDLGESAEEAARELFRGLRALDAAQSRAIVAVWRQEAGLGLAVSNRLTKAASETWKAAPASHIAFVCTGNTCRSAMASALLRTFRPDWQVESVGTHAFHGAPAASPAVQAVARFGGDLTHHQARSLDVLQREEPEVILTMTRSQAHAVLRRFPGWEGRVFLLTEFVGESGDIADPVGQGQNVYDTLAAELWRLIQRIPKATDAFRRRSAGRKG